MQKFEIFLHNKKKTTMLAVTKVLVIISMWISITGRFGSVSAFNAHISTCDLSSNVLTVGCSDHPSKKVIQTGMYNVACDGYHTSLTDVAVIKSETCDFNQHNHHLLQKFGNLRRIDLSSNQISSINGWAFENATTLNHMDLSYNRIDGISLDNFVGLSQLKRLNLQNNIIEHIPMYTFAILWNLIELNLSHNRLRTIGTTIFTTFNHLETLDISFNNIAKMKATALDGLKHLELLNISYCELTTIELGSFSSLEKLDLSNNRLRSIKFLTKSNQLWQLYLNDNKLKKFQNDFSKQLPYLHELRIANNSFSCYGLKVMKQIFKQKKMRLDVENEKDFDCFRRLFQFGFGALFIILVVCATLFSISWVLRNGVPIIVIKTHAKRR